jgi:alkylated DNA repair protein (DNA oxidative demethylase)
MPGQAELFVGVAMAPREEAFAAGALLLRGYAGERAAALDAVIEDVIRQAPLRHMVTPGGLSMSVAMTACGPLGWVTDRRGYRYTALDPDSGRPWPAMPEVLRELATAAAAHAGYVDFAPDACLVNCYRPGARMSLHQDRDEQDFSQPIVSISLGLPATFLFGGASRSDRPQRLRLDDGDVVVWGGPSRLFFHGVAALAEGHHPRIGAQRINLTLRRAGAPSP